METTTNLATITAPIRTLRAALAGAYVYADHINKRPHLIGIKIAAGTEPDQLITVATNSYTLAEITTPVTAAEINQDHDLIVHPKPIIDALTTMAKLTNKNHDPADITLTIGDMHGQWALTHPAQTSTGTGAVIAAQFPTYDQIITGSDTFTGPAAISPRWWAQLDKLAKELTGNTKHETAATVHTLTPNKPAIITMNTTEHHARIAIMPQRV